MLKICNLKNKDSLAEKNLNENQSKEISVLVGAAEDDHLERGLTSLERRFSLLQDDTPDPSITRSSCTKLNRTIDVSEMT